jgi:long-chain acyl-CoA synthetase
MLGTRPQQKSATNTSDLADWLGGPPERPALDVGRRLLTYGEVALEATRRSGQLTLGVVDVSAPDLVDTLLNLYGALGAGRPVLVRDPASVSPELGDPPNGAEVMVTTSGSTGRPRVVARTWESWECSLEPFTQVTGLRPGDRIAVTGPLHASMHLFGALHALALGATLVGDPAQATVVHAVPSTLDALLRAGLRPRVAIVAGSGLGDALARRAHEAGVTVVEYYGAAELSFVAARRWPEPLTSFPAVEIDVRDDLLWAKSPYLALGYAGRSGPLLVSPDGFATVGDRAEWDGSVLRVRGRGDAAITTGGSTVLAEDIEAVLAELPGVLAVVVVGTPHERFGELVTAVLELDTDAQPTMIRQLAHQRLQASALPRRWLEARLPRIAGGKPARASVRDGILDGTLAVTVLSATSMASDTRTSWGTEQSPQQAARDGAARLG